jgi:hypothetical protein
MEQLPDDSNAAESNSLAVIVDSIGALLGRVPASLHRNVTKALAHLCRVPLARNEANAEEIKALSEARVEIIKATATKLAQAVEIDSSLAQIATRTHVSKILRQQENAIGVLKYAVEELDSLPRQNRVEPTLGSETDRKEPTEISDDWLNAFESEAINMSSEQMQRLFGKMLAGEIRKPSSYSVRTVKLMGQMDVDVAQLFQRFCSMCITLKLKGDKTFHSRVLTFGRNHVHHLNSYGLDFLKIGALSEYGLLSESQPTELPYNMSVNGCIPGKLAPLKYDSQYYMLEAIPPHSAADFSMYDELGLALSRAGRELLSIVDIEENKQYTEALKNHLKEKGLRLVLLPNPRL